MHKTYLYFPISLCYTYLNINKALLCLPVYGDYYKEITKFKQIKKFYVHLRNTFLWINTFFQLFFFVKAHIIFALIFRSIVVTFHFHFRNLYTFVQSFTSYLPSVNIITISGLLSEFDKTITVLTCHEWKELNLWVRKENWKSTSSNKERGISFVFFFIMLPTNQIGRK